MGDQIQFCRYVPMLKAQGASRITVVCRAPLKSLLGRLAGADQVLTTVEAEDVPNHDYWTFPLSIPLHCNTTLDNVPAAIPYLYADEKLSQDMATQLAEIAEFKVGVCWQGSKTYKGDAERSPGMEPFKKLFRLAGVRFFTLQPGSREEFLAAAGATALDLGHDIDALTPPFEETAALIMNLDLIITCDTSIGHLAGALGKTVWVVLPFIADWRWMADREDSPWYPNTRLFRQTRRGDWEELFDRVALRLQAVIAGEFPALWPAAEPSSQEIQTLEALFAEWRYAEAATLAQTLTQRFPQHGFGWKALGIAFKHVGRNGDAVVSLKKAAALLPGDVNTYSNLGVILRDLGRLEEAEASYRRALEIKPDHAEAHNNLGNTLHDLGRLEEAEASYRRALEIRPDFAEGHRNLSITLQDLVRYVEAEANCRRALEIKPDYAEAHFELGNTLHELGRLEEAEASYRRALKIKPDYVEAHNNLGGTLFDLDRLDEAEASCRQALRIKSDCVEAHYNLGKALRGLGRPDEAEASYRRALALKPDYADASLNLGHLLLHLGEFEEGWKRYESRYDPAMKEHLPIPPDAAFPQWQGQPLAGKTLLVRHEQGMGDQIQFCRYVPMLKAQGASRITVVCRAPLKSLLGRLAGADQVLTTTEAEDVPNHDYWTFPLSIPLHCNTTLDNVPAVIPYLYADELRSQEMATQLANMAEFKVGVCWQGSKTHKRDAERSPGVEPFKKLFRLAGVRFFTLQPGSREEFLAAAGATALDLGHEIDALTFEETAALIMNLDLVITCDTSIAHLAGALGKTVWVVLPFIADWRWMADREDSPWYPNTRLFRQTRRGDWEELFDRVALRLQAVIAGKFPALWHVAEQAPHLLESGGL